MSVLVLDVLHPKSAKMFGRVEVHDIVQLSATNPIDKYVLKNTKFQESMTCYFYVSTKLQS